MDSNDLDNASGSISTSSEMKSLAVRASQVARHQCSEASSDGDLWALQVLQSLTVLQFTAPGALFDLQHTSAEGTWSQDSISLFSQAGLRNATGMRLMMLGHHLGESSYVHRRPLSLLTKLRLNRSASCKAAATSPPPSQLRANRDDLQSKRRSAVELAEEQLQRLHGPQEQVQSFLAFSDSEQVSTWVP